MRRLTAIPAIGPITASATKALVPDISGLTSALHFAAWLGLTPRPHSSGSKERFGKILKLGNTTLRTLLVVDATTVVSHRRRSAKAGATGPVWIAGLLNRRPPKLAAVALANKMARIVYAMLTNGTQY